jgi:hypothetical protein
MKERKRIGSANAWFAGLVLTFIALTLCLAPIVNVWAFKPKNSSSGKNSTDSTHQSITEDSIKETEKEVFGITTQTKSMKKAMDDIASANAAVDVDSFFSSEHHFDAESFTAGQTLLISEFTSTVSALKNKNASAARTKFGQALHTIQDFYSHSDWVELGNTGPNPNLGRPKQTISNTSPSTEATCQNCGTGTAGCADCTKNVITKHLTSGYFGILLSSKPAGKCSHGGSGDATSSSAPTGGINKDTSLCSSSPHFALHTAAATVAKAATKQFLNDVKAAVSPSEFKLLLGIGPTLTISMDTTGSMGSIIDSVKNQAIQIVDSRIGTDEEPSKYVLAPFNDPDVGPLTVTDDPAVFKAAISALSASGGGDCPELAMAGMLQGLGASEDGGDLFMFTDATAKDSALASNVSSIATSKDIKVFPFLFGSCSPIDPGYIRVANESGGQVFLLNRDEAGTITNLADAVVRSNSVDLLSIGDTLTGTSKSFSVPIDSTLSRITFSVSGATDVVITRPGGAPVAPGDPDVTMIPLSTGAIFTIRAPSVGIWSATINGTGDFSLLTVGDSTLAPRSFNFVELAGRPDHDGLFPINGLPIVGTTNIGDGVIDGDFMNAQFELRSKTGVLLQNLSLTRGTGLSGNEFIGEVSLPLTPFLVYITGLDSAGNPFQRLIARTIQPQTVKVTAPPTQDLQQGKITSYIFQVQNLGASDTFRISATDDLGFSFGPSATILTLNSGQIANVTVQVQTPASAATDISDILTVTAESTGATGARNFAVVTSLVGIPNRPPDVSQAVPSIASLWPPDHQLVPISILGVTDPDGDPVTITITSVTQNQPTGPGNFCPDATGIGSSSVSLRSERNGIGNFRVYTLLFTATDGRGGSSSGSVNVVVPHDQGVMPPLPAGGGSFDSTSCSK